MTDAYADPRFNATVDASSGFLTRNLMAAPIPGPDGQPIGVLQVLNKRRSANSGFTIVDRVLLSIFAAQTSMILANDKVGCPLVVCGATVTAMHMRVAVAAAAAVVWMAVRCWAHVCAGVHVCAVVCGAGPCNNHLLPRSTYLPSAFARARVCVCVCVCCFTTYWWGFF